MFSDGPKYAFEHFKLRNSCSFGNWSSSIGREYFLITTLQIYCILSRWEGLWLATKYHKLAQRYKMMDNRALQRETRCFTDNSHVISNQYSDGDKNLTNLHIKQWKTVIKLCSCCFHWCTFCYCSHPLHDVKCPVLQLCGRREQMMTNSQIYSCYLQTADINLISG